MKLVVGIDDNGDFFAVNFTNREQVIEALSQFVGDVDLSELEDDIGYALEEGLLDVDNSTWEKYVGAFEEQGRLQIISNVK